MPDFAVDLDVAIRLLDEAVDHAEAEAGSFAGFLRGEKRFEHSVQDGGRNAGAGIADRQQDIGAGPGVRIPRRVVLVQHDVAGLDRQLAALPHRVARVHSQVDQGGLQLRGIDHGQPDLRVPGWFPAPPVRRGFAAADSVSSTSPFRLTTRGSSGCFREKASRLRTSSAPRSAARSAMSAVSRARASATGPFGQQVQIADDDGQKVVEVVGDAAGQLADAFHLLGLRQLALRHPSIGHILTNGDDAGRGVRRAIVLKSLGPDGACAAIRARDVEFVGVCPAIRGTALDRLFQWPAIRFKHSGKEFL